MSNDYSPKREAILLVLNEETFVDDINKSLAANDDYSLDDVITMGAPTTVVDTDQSFEQDPGVQADGATLVIDFILNEDGYFYSIIDGGRDNPNAPETPDTEDPVDGEDETPPVVNPDEIVDPDPEATAAAEAKAIADAKIVADA